MLEAHDLGVTIGRQQLLAGVSLEVRPAELVGVIGPNGAGKSTLLKVLCGDRRPTTGEVWMERRRLAEWPARARARVRAVLPQESSLAFPFTALEVVLMGRAPHVQRAEGPRDLEIAWAALDACGVLALAERRYPTLSGGEKQRVHLARVLAQVWEEPPTGARYILLDEPTASLDPAHQHRTLALARRFAREGGAVLAVLHDLNLAAQYADRLCLLAGGRLLAAGEPAAVLVPDRIRAAFGLHVTVTTHPSRPGPLVVPLADVEQGVIS